MGIKEFIKKKAWFDYTIHHPFLTKEQREKVKEYASGYGCYNAYHNYPSYSELHPKDDELLAELKAMLNPHKSETLFSRLKYYFQRFIRKHTDVGARALMPRSKEDQEAFKRIHEEDKKRNPNWEAIEAEQKRKWAEWENKELARKLSERCFVYKSDRPLRKH